MADLTTLAQLIDSLANRTQKYSFFKTGVNSTTTFGASYSHWLSTGQPGLGAAPGTTAAIPTDATAGALCPLTNATSGSVLRLFDIDVQGTNLVSPLWLYDRLVHHGGLDSTDTALKTVNTPAINRGNANGVGVMAFVEIYTVLGATPQTLTIKYTNTVGTSGQTATVDLPASPVATRVFRVVPAVGDLGFKSIETVQLGGSTGTAGSYGVTLARKICGLPIGLPQFGTLRRGFELGYPTIEPDACLWLIQTDSDASATIASPIFGSLTIFATG